MLTSTSTNERALDLLGSGVPANQVSAALGVSESYISQLMGQEEFAAAVVMKRYESLASHNAHDKKLDEIEARLIEKVEESMEMLFRPEQLLKAAQIINSMKRRGSSTPEQITNKQSVVQIIMPVKVIQKFTTNIQNQVVEVGEQTLVTAQSGVLMDALKKKQKELENTSDAKLIEVIPHEHQSPRITEDRARTVAATPVAA